MPNAFNFAAAPFDCLSADERQLVRDHVDIEYFPEGAEILAPGAAVTHLYVVIKGHVRQLDGEAGRSGEAGVTTYGPDDCFDGRALVAGQASSRFVAGEEVIAYRLAREAVMALIAGNATFSALLFADISQKLAAIGERSSQREMQALTMAKVSEAGVRPARAVPGITSIVEVARLFTEHRSTHVLVDDGTRLGIFTTAGLQRAILHGTPLDRLPVAELMSAPLIAVKPDDLLFDALATMIRHRVQRVVVSEHEAPSQPGQVLGVLEQIDLLSFLSNHSYLVTRQILEAESLQALAAPAAHITRIIGLLYRGGTPVRQIARLVQELNAKLFERAWQLVAPPELVANSCLFVMGSEGRGEQLLKTDQDNALVLRDGYVPPDDLAAICERFSLALASFGYPECPGRIMLSNPEWRHPAAEFAQVVRRWLLMPTPESLMALAIFLDAHAVCGDATLLEGLRTQVFELVIGNDALMARFAAAIDAFDQASGWWNRLFTAGEAQLDLKKLGTFPLVHGIRAMALEARLPATGTVERIQALVAAGRLPAELAPELIDSLHFFMGLKLKLGLAGQGSGREVSLEQLDALDRQLLKDTLGVVKRFKALLRHRYRLDAL